MILCIKPSTLPPLATVSKISCSYLRVVSLMYLASLSLVILSVLTLSLSARSILAYLSCSILSRALACAPLPVRVPARVVASFTLPFSSANLIESIIGLLALPCNISSRANLASPSVSIDLSRPFRAALIAL